MTREEFDAFIASLSYHKRQRFLRKGQWMFNLLWTCFPDIADKIRTTEFDPFFDDSRIPAFLKHLEENYVE
jgi:hypothetical protein